MQTTRKAIKTIKANLQQKNDVVLQHSQQVVNVRDAYRNKLKDMGDDNKREIQSIKEQFNTLRNILNEK